jgi:hypothetical protein
LFSSRRRRNPPATTGAVPAWSKRHLIRAPRAAEDLRPRVDRIRCAEPAVLSYSIPLSLRHTHCLTCSLGLGLRRLPLVSVRKPSTARKSIPVLTSSSFADMKFCASLLVAVAALVSVGAAPVRPSSNHASIFEFCCQIDNAALEARQWNTGGTAPTTTSAGLDGGRPRGWKRDEVVSRAARSLFNPYTAAACGTPMEHGRNRRYHDLGGP